MDALRDIVNHVPSWQKRLDELGNQIELRQAELAAVELADPRPAEMRSLRNKGSTESLKPKDERSSYVESPSAGDTFLQLKFTTAAPENSQSSPNLQLNGASLRGSQCPLLEAGTFTKARTTAASTRSPNVPVYGDRTRRKIKVYYDSYVQSFFDELVRYISASRNLMRKAKMAARVAQIKRLAEMELPDENEVGEDGGEALPSLRYMNPQRFQTSLQTRIGGHNEAADVYDELDANLEFVQSTCEHGAHQFLRDANCNEEVKKIQVRLKIVLDAAAKEMNRIQRDEPNLAQEEAETCKARTRRPISIRRDLPTMQKTELSCSLVNGEKSPIPRPLEAELLKYSDSPPNILEVDTDLQEDYDQLDEQAMPQLQYRSTRTLRNPASMSNMRDP